MPCRAEPARGAGEQALALLLSPQGDFVRGILLEELAKGLDAAWRIAADQSSGRARAALSSLLGVSPCLQCLIASAIGS